MVGSEPSPRQHKRHVLSSQLGLTPCPRRPGSSPWPCTSTTSTCLNPVPVSPRIRLRPVAWRIQDQSLGACLTAGDGDERRCLTGDSGAAAVPSEALPVAGVLGISSNSNTTWTVQPEVKSQPPRPHCPQFHCGTRLVFTAVTKSKSTASGSVQYPPASSSATARECLRSGRLRTNSGYPERIDMRQPWRHVLPRPQLWGYGHR